MIRLSVLLFFFLTLISCPNDVMRDLVETKVSSPVASSVEINNGMPGTPARTVTISADVSKENDVLEMRLRNESGSWSSWMTYSKNVEWTLSDGDGVKTVTVEVRDQGHRTVSLASTIILDTTVPEGGFKVRGTNTWGAADSYINTNSAVLFMNIVNAYYMRFNNEGGPWSGWEPYVPSKLWTLSSGDALKTVNAEFSDIAYNPVLAPSHNITLDKTAPLVSGFLINSGDATTNNASVGLGYTCTEANRVWTQYMNDGGSWSAAEEITAGGVTREWSLRAVNGTRTVSVRLTDIAGNVSAVHSDTIYLNTEAPDYPLPSADTPTNDTTPVWSWEAVAEASRYRLRINGGAWIYTEDTAWTPSAPLGQGEHLFEIQAADIADNWSATGSHTVLIDTEPPVFALSSVTSSNANPDYAKTGDTLTFNFTGSDNLSGINVDIPCVFILGRSLTVEKTGSNSYRLEYTITSDDAEGLIEYSTGARDYAGNEQESVSGLYTGITLDRTSPVLSGITSSTSNTDSSWAKPGDTITVSFSVTETGSGINGVPTVTIAGNAATVISTGGGSYSATYVMQSSNTEGIIMTGINVFDNAGNTRSGGGSTGITFDKTAPVVSFFTLNNGNTYAASPFVMASYSVTDALSGVESMQLQGASSTGVIPYVAPYYLNAPGGNVTAWFTDFAGNTSAGVSDTITIQSNAADIRYEDQGMPSHLGSAAFDLGHFSDWDIYGGDAATGDLQTLDVLPVYTISGNATLWDEDWYMFYMDTGYDPQFTISSDSVIGGSVSIDAFSDEEGADLLDFSTTVSGDGKSITIEIDWSWNPPKYIWIRIHRPDNNYSGTSYNLSWSIPIL